MTDEETRAVLLDAAYTTAHQLWQFTRTHTEGAHADLNLHAGVAFAHLERAHQALNHTSSEDSV